MSPPATRTSASPSASGIETARGDLGSALARWIISSRRPQDLKQVTTFLVAGRVQAPVVDHEYVDAGELDEQADVAAIGARQAQFVEEP